MILPCGFLPRHCRQLHRNRDYASEACDSAHGSRTKSVGEQPHHDIGVRTTADNDQDEKCYGFTDLVWCNFAYHCGELPDQTPRQSIEYQPDTTVLKSGIAERNVEV